MKMDCSSGIAPNTDPVIQDDSYVLVSAFMAGARAAQPLFSLSLAVIDDVCDDQGFTAIRTAVCSKAKSSMTYDGLSLYEAIFVLFH